MAWIVFLKLPFDINSEGDILINIVVLGLQIALFLLKYQSLVESCFISR